ncbi:MAG TPA: hypothetical protein VF221_19250 [Chloroflexota bacterium]
MAKRATRNKQDEKMQRKLQKARQRFEAAQNDYLLVRERGKQQVEKAQLQAERTLTKANERLERRAQVLARAEERALATGSTTTQVAVVEGNSDGTATPASPDTAANVVEQLQAEHDASEAKSPLVVPEGS